MAQVMLLSTEYRADVRAIAVVQTMRGLLLTAGLPAGLALFGLAGPSASMTRAGAESGSLLELAVLFAVSTAAGFAMFWLRLPGGLLFGTMLGSAVLHGGGFVHAVLPEWLAIVGVVGVGALTGARFAGTSPRMIASYLGAALGSFALVVTIASCFCVLVATMLPVRVADAVIAFAPGAQDTMMVLALAMHLDPVFVGAHHLARYVVVSIAVPLLVQRAAGPPPKKGQMVEVPKSSTGIEDK
jgi:membrane AbrB-like protein